MRHYYRKAPYGPLFSTIPAEVPWTRIVEDGMVVYGVLASMLLGDIANRIGRVILQDLVGYLGRRYAYDDVETAMGPAQARRVLDNFNTKIWCQLADDRTAAEATEGLGLCTVRLPDTGCA